MEQDQLERRRFVCKFCNQSFSNGRVLGGHMRSHKGLNSSKGKRKISNGEMGSEENDDSGYVLRENPKKSWKFSGSGGGGGGGGGDHLCQVCGKRFESPRALFGHMRHHSNRERNGKILCTECGKGFGTLRALTGHMRWHPEAKTSSTGDRSQELFGDGFSDNETAAPGPVRKKRSRRVVRYKNSCSFSDLNNESSSVTGCEQELEDAAMCLMMIYNSVCESSDNNSVSFEAKSLDQIVRNVKFSENGSGFEAKKPKLDHGSCTELKLRFKDDLVEEFARDPGYLKPGFDAQDHPELGVNSESENLDDSKKKSQYKCRICSKSFHTHQALGGHCNAHKSAIKACSALKVEDCDKDTETTISSEIEPICKLVDYEYNDTSAEQEISSCAVATSDELKRIRKVHECPVCFKVFRSGQALGGHKRAHILKSGDSKEDEEAEGNIELEQQHCDVTSETVSLKASGDTEEEANSDVAFKAWWDVGSNGGCLISI